MTQILKSYLEYICGAENVRENEPLSAHTTLRIGGAAKLFVIVQSKEKLLKLISAMNFIEEPVFIIGNGSNLLVSDYGFDGVVVKIAFAEIVDNGNFIYADAGVQLAKLTRFAVDNGLTGLEWASGIPATVGGAVYMNAGAHGGAMSDVVVCVDVLVRDKDGSVEIQTISAEKLKFNYRTSIFQKRKDWIIVGAYCFLAKGDKDEIKERGREFLEKRRKAIPSQPNGGSTFKKPSDNFFVGKVVEELGLKGKMVGGAQISEKHAGIIVNKDGATCADVLALIKIIKKEVYKSTGTRLKLEYEIVGEVQPPAGRTKQSGKSNRA